MNIIVSVCKRIPEEWRNTDKKLCDVASGSEYDNVRDMFQRTGNFHIKKVFTFLIHDKCIASCKLHPINNNYFLLFQYSITSQSHPITWQNNLGII